MENGAVHTLTHTVKYSILQVCRVLLSFGGLARRKLGFANTRLRNRHLPGWRFHRFRLMRIVTVQPRICNVMVIGIYSPPFRECSPNRPPLMLVYAWSSGLRGRQYSTINAPPCLLLPPGFGGFFCVFQSKSTKRLPTQARNPLRRRGFRAFDVSALARSLPNVYQGNISR